MTSGGEFKALSSSGGASSSFPSAAETAEAVKKFKALGVCDQLAEAAAALGWTAPTEIQAAAVPHLLAGEKKRWRKTGGNSKQKAAFDVDRDGDGLLSFPNAFSFSSLFPLTLFFYN